MSVMFYVWLGIFITALVVEIAVPGLVSIWFSAGALIPFVLSIFIGDKLIWLQILIFVIVSFGTIALLRPLIKGKGAKDYRSNVDSLIGSVAFSESRIEPYKLGTVKVNGLTWNAGLESDDMDPIEPEQKVIIKGIKGNKLFVELFKEDKE